jgi:hypothetical protein
MADELVTFVDANGVVVATARVSDEGGRFQGDIDLRPMPAGMRRTFEEYEDIVNGQTFSLLDEIEEKVQSLSLRVVFADGREVRPDDLQIYPSTGKVSFRA